MLVVIDETNDSVLRKGQLHMLMLRLYVPTKLPKLLLKDICVRETDGSLILIAR